MAFPLSLNPMSWFAPSKQAETAPPKQGAIQGQVNTINASTGFEGASMARRLSPWMPNRAHINSQLTGELPTLRARSRALIQNTTYGASAAETFTSYAAGTGIVPGLLVDNNSIKKRIMQMWTDWTDEADADGVLDFYGIQALVARSVFEAGECFVRRRFRDSTSNLTVPLQLQVLESDMLDSAYTLTGPGGNPIRCGIEFDIKTGQRVAYWFWENHPGDLTLSPYQGNRVRIPAEEICHIYKPQRPGQLRGIPFMTPVMVKMYDLDQYTDAELTRKKGAAMFMAFVESEAGQEVTETGLVNENTEADAAGTAEVVMEPGLAQILPEGTKVHFNEPGDVGPNYEMFIYRSVLELCSAMGLMYFSVSGDTTKANFSSMRSALIDMRRRIERFQNEVLIFQLCRPVWNWWLPTAMLAGLRIPGYTANPRTYNRVNWRTPRWDWVDPYKDLQSEKLAVDAGFKSRSDVIRGMGEDPAEVDAEIASDHAREDELGLAFAVGLPKNVDPTAMGTDVAPSGADTQDANTPPAANAA